MSWPHPPWTRALLALATIIACAWLTAPALWLLLTSIMTEAESMATPPHWIPEAPTLDNYRALLAPTGFLALGAGGAAMQMPRAILNSILIGTSVVVLNLSIGTLAAYSLARVEFRGVRRVLIFYLASRMVPGVALVVPMFLIIKAIGLIDHPLAIILTHTGFTLPFTIWILRSYFQTIPRELEDAAIVDRCTFGDVLWRVLLPVARPGLVGAGLFAFMSSWGEFLFALIFASTERAKTIPVVVAELATDVDIRYTLMTSAGVIAIIPPLVLAFVFQRMIVSGLLAGSVKG